jgi:hypothetical protein
LQHLSLGSMLKPGTEIEFAIFIFKPEFDVVRERINFISFQDIERRVQNYFDDLGYLDNPGVENPSLFAIIKIGNIIRVTFYYRQRSLRVIATTDEQGSNRQFIRVNSNPHLIVLDV